MRGLPHPTATIFGAKPQTRLRGCAALIKRHWNFAAFVHLWVNRDKVTDAERVDVIKHHPSLKKWIEDDSSYQQSGDNGK